jgi:hypothetical protein
MRTMLLSVAALISAACMNKASPHAADRVPTAAAAQAAPAAPAAKADRQAEEPMKVEANVKKTSRLVKVAKTTQQKATQQKVPVTEGLRKDGPG